MRVFKIKNEPFDSFMYIVTVDDKNCLIIDLGADFSIAEEVLKSENLKPVAVLSTHNHFDHVCGVKSARDRNIPVYISTLDAKGLESEEGTLAEYAGVRYNPIFDYKTFDEGEYDFGGIKVNVLSTPGHTEGSVVFIIEDEMFSGDTLFYHTVGRTDLPGSNEDDMICSINRLIALFSEKQLNYAVHPGHGRDTDLLEEYMLNPFYIEHAEY